MKSVYLDYAAATPVSKRVLRAMEPYFSEKFYNPSALYLAAKDVAADISQARDKVAGHLGVRSSEIIFTAGGTEANNLAIKGIMDGYPEGRALVASSEHASVLEATDGYNQETINVDSSGRLLLEDLKAKIDDATVLVSVAYANSEIGVIQPLKEVANIIKNVRSDRAKRNITRPLYFHTDACQAANYLPLQVSRLGVDLMTLNGGKIYGPKQSGALYCHAGIALVAQLHGGGQEFSLRSGTENVPAIIGFAQALEESQAIKTAETERLQILQSKLIEKLHSLDCEITINGSLHNRVVNNVHATFHGKDNERLLMELDERGVMCAVGSACSASKDTPSHVLKAIGLSDELARSSLRFSLGRQTDQDSVDYLIKQLREIL